MLPIEIEQEVDGRWIVEVMSVPGVLAYGATRDEACRGAQALLQRVLQEWAASDHQMPIDHDPDGIVP